MILRPGLFCLAYLLLAATPVWAKDGDLLSREPVRLTLSYAAWFDRAFAASDEQLDPKPDLTKARAYYTKALYRGLGDRKAIEADRIIYQSDGLKIGGVIVRPHHGRGRLPVIIWCRGGVGMIGGVTLGDVLIMSNWARAGYVVIATNYRGGPRSEGHDEDGGADVRDVLALVPLARSLPDADADRLFLYGQSRGGMEVYRAMAEGFRAQAAVVNSGVTDLDAPSGRPDAADIDTITRAAMPDYAVEVASHFCRRSAVCWPEKISAPVLLLHGTADWRVPASQTLHLAAELQALHKPYAMNIVEGGAHVWLDQDQAAIDRDVLAFFRLHGGV